MKTRAYILGAFAVLLIAGLTGSRAHAEDGREYQVKAAFVYNFIKFVDWPKHKIADANHTITVGIIGENPFAKAFDPIKGKKVKGRKLLIKSLPPFKNYRGKYTKQQKKLYKDTLNKCHVLFISRSEKDHFREILALVKNGCVLTVGDSQGLLEAGAVINFTTQDKRVRFEINAHAAKQAKLKIRSQLLRLAKKVIGENQAEVAKK
ncbi:MAG: YfiR family protein [Planctomycetota bacterium]|jgi:hypothetical protein